MTGDDEVQAPTFREVLAGHDQMRRRVDAARGELIVAMIELEDMVDETLVRYFDPADPDRYQQWVLAEMNANTKFQLLQKLIKTHHLWGVYGELWREIDGLRVERNSAAHANYALAESGLSDEGNIMLNRRSARRPQEEPTDLEALQTHAARARRIRQEYIALDHFIHEAHKCEGAEDRISER